MGGNKVQRLVVVMMFACFMLANLPLITATAENSSELVVLDVGEAIAEQSIDSNDVIVKDPRSLEKEIERRQKEQEEIQNEIVKTGEDPEPLEEPKVKSDNKPSDKGLNIEQSITPPIPSYIPDPPSPTWTEVSGVLPTQTWTVAGSPYYVIGNITIPVGNTLTLNPGVQVLFNGTFEILVSGTLTAIANVGSHITFDTNFAGFWEDIEFDATGAGTFTYADFDGATDAIHFLNATNTVEISYCTFNTNIANFGIWIEGESSCGLNIHDNTFDTTNYSVYEDVCFLTSGTVTVGGRTFSDNTINGAWGYYSNRLEFDNPGDGAVITVGQTQIDQNTFTNAQQSIYIGNYHVHDKQYGTVNWGANIITSNSITQSANAGIYWYGRVDNVTDTTVNLGLMSVINNNITNTGGRAINVDFWDLTNLSGTTSVYLGPTNINDNDVYTGGGGSDGIYVLFDAMGEPIFDSAYIHMADFMIANNEVFNCDGNAIYFDAYVGMNMSGYSNLRFGDFIIDNNDIYQSTGAGIYVYWDYLGYNMYQYSRIVMGDIVVSNNVVTSIGNATYLYLDEFGYYMYQDTQMSVGLLSIHDNVFNSTNYNGSYIYVYDFGCYMNGDATATYGGFYCSYNDFISWNGEHALYIDEISNIATYNNGNTVVTYGDLIINHNTFDGWHYGMYIEDVYHNGYYLYGDSSLIWGDVEMNNNVGTSMRDDTSGFQEGDAIYFDWDYCAYRLYSTSHAEFGHFEFNDNNVSVLFGDSANGMDVDVEYTGWYLYDRATFRVRGNMELCRNYINNNVSSKYWAVGAYGIYMNFGHIAGEGEGFNDFRVQNFYVNDNTVWANGTGMDVEFEYFARDMDGGGGTVWTGDFECNRNWVWSNGSTGIDCDRNEMAWGSDNYNVRFGDMLLNDNVVNISAPGAFTGIRAEAEWFSERAEGNGTVIFGEIICDRNNINSSGDGIYVDYSYWGYYGQYTSRTYFGNATINDNIIVAQDDGIYCTDWMYDVGYGGDDSVYVQTGDWEMCRNNIVANGTYGMKPDIDWVGQQLENDVEVRIGDIRICDNVVNNSGGDGIYLDTYAVADDVDDGSVVYVGSLFVCNNTIVAADDGIWCDIDDWVESLEDGAQAYVGDVNFNDNVIDTEFYEGDEGIHLEYDDVVSYIEESCIGMMGDLNVLRNDIRANNSGMFMDYEWVVEDCHHSAVATIGDVNINWNTIWSDEGHGFYLDDFYAVASDFEMVSRGYHGDFNFNDNIINSTNASGFYCNRYDDVGEDLSEGAKVFFGDMNHNRNTIVAKDYGIYYEDPSDVGENIEENGYVVLGDWNFNDNDIQCTNKDSIYFNPDDFGTNNDDASKVYIGTHRVMGNTLSSTYGVGLDTDWLSGFGHLLYEGAYVEIGDCIISNNNIITPNNASILCDAEYVGQNAYDSSTLIIGDYSITDNTIDANNTGIDLNFTYVGYQMGQNRFATASSSVTLGNIMINDNTIDSEVNESMNLNFEYWGRDMNESCSVNIGNIEINGNEMTGNNEGAEIDIYGWGYNVTEQATVNIGMMEVSNNTMDCGSNNDAFDLDVQYMAYDIYNYSEVYVGDIYIRDNTISDGWDGFSIWTDNCQQVWNFSYAEIPGLHAYNNIVTCNGLGLNLSYYNDPGNVHTTATAIWEPWEIYDTTFNSDYGMAVDSDDAPALPAWNIHDLTFQGTAVGGSDGIHIQDVDPATPFIVKTSTFDSYDRGLNATSGAFIRAAMCDFTTVSTDDVYLDTDSNAFMLDCVFDKTNVNYVDALSTLDIGWYFTVYTETPGGIRVPFADLTAISNSGGGPITEIDQTDANGEAVMMLRETRHNQANPFPAFLLNFNDHNITATKSVNTGWAIPEVTVTGIGGSTIIILGDGIPPTLGADSSDLVATTGDLFRFAVSAGDDMGIDYVEVHYQINAGPWSSSFMTPNGIWEHTITAPHVLGTINYYFVVGDIGGNSFTGPTESVSIIDNDAPFGYVDNTPDIIYSITPNLDFNIGISDNIGIGDVYLIFWYHSYAKTNVTMSGAGPYTHSHAVDFGESMIYYYVAAVDTSGNWFVGPLSDVVVEDIDFPVLLQDLSDTNATTGDPFNFDFRATDDGSIVEHTVTYWFGTGNATTVNLTAGANNSFTLTITIPSDSLDTLYYYVTLVDNVGNTLTTATKSVTVTDNDAPVLVSDGSDTTATTGDPFNFEASGDDNIGVEGIEVVYWFGTGANTTMTLNLASGIYTGTITIPSNSLDPLHYHLVVTDTSGNTHSEPQQDVTVVDNDAPVAGADASDTNAVTGQLFDFNIAASDNIGVTGAYVIYWFGTGARTNATLTGTGPYLLNISIPANSTDALNYYFAFRDAAGNWHVTSVATLAVDDDGVPSFGTDDTPDNTTENADLTFSIQAFDNVGIADIYVVYWTNAEWEYAYAQLILVGGYYQGVISVPDGTLLYYYFVATDEAGNSAQTSEATITVQLDDDGDVVEEPAESFFGTYWWIIIVIILVIVIILQAVLNSRKGGGGSEEISFEETEASPPPAEASPTEPETTPPETTSEEA